MLHMLQHALASGGDEDLSTISSLDDELLYWQQQQSPSDNAETKENRRAVGKPSTAGLVSEPAAPLFLRARVCRHRLTENIVLTASVNRGAVYVPHLKTLVSTFAKLRSSIGGETPEL